MTGNNIFIGIDTSCYTTSFCICNENKNILLNYRSVLEVKNGNCGLRQSDAVFEHIKNFSSFFEQNNIHQYGTIKAICVSVVPRLVEGSYMPVFMVGKDIAQSIASSCGIPIYKTSHQHGHLFSAMHNKENIPEKFTAVHLSGGTSEILLVENQSGKMNISITGGTKDISAGKVIDRTGVMLGLSFPAGPDFEQIASEAQEDLNFKISVDKSYFNLSGIQSLAEQHFNKTPSDILCKSVESAITRTLSSAILNACSVTSTDYCLLFGGVICNRYIKENIVVNLNQHGIKAEYALPEFSGDNACGLAFHARDKYIREH